MGRTPALNKQRIRIRLKAYDHADSRPIGVGYRRHCSADRRERFRSGASSYGNQSLHRHSRLRSRTRTPESSLRSGLTSA